MDPEKQRVVQVSITQLPEMVFRLRREMADMLRREAGTDTNPAFSKRLRELAAQFDIGATGVKG